ncbi:hypothetical protein B484DRAFT_455371 [Ochromonadaceae sp. CCMP2298]|nr:hypothetical protein B484DRAFT_455371 [Ochromonadaceae sp. CCMP2298]|mmetsp:Transcript_31447/g.69299  ORF Transcript_31447/g.69299 Transcript_31447/m.69299 type:complete len:315 (+) Transcript_31447:192-1136(+)
MPRSRVAQTSILLLLLLSLPLEPSQAFLQGLASNLIAILPTREQLRPPVNIPQSVRLYYPLPQEELLTSFSRGNAYLISGQFDAALREFSRAADVAPDTADVYLSRGIAYEKLGEWNLAIEDYKTANGLLKRRPFARDDPTALSNMANAETGLGQWEDALRDFNSAAKIAPDFQAPQIGRALVLYQLDRREEACAYFLSMTQRYPLFADGQAALAVMQFALGSDGSGNSGSGASLSKVGGSSGGTSGGYMASAQDHWEQALEEDSRYVDVEWVRDIRRWPPALVKDLQLFKSRLAQEQQQLTDRTETALILLNI